METYLGIKQWRIQNFQNRGANFGASVNSCKFRNKYYINVNLVERTNSVYMGRFCKNILLKDFFSNYMRMIT